MSGVVIFISSLAPRLCTPLSLCGVRFVKTTLDIPNLESRLQYKKSVCRESFRTLIKVETLNEVTCGLRFSTNSMTTVSAGCFRQNIFIANCSNSPSAQGKGGYELKHLVQLLLSSPKFHRFMLCSNFTPQLT